MLTSFWSLPCKGHPKPNFHTEPGYMSQNFKMGYYFLFIPAQVQSFTSYPFTISTGPYVNPHA